MLYTGNSFNFIDKYFFDLKKVNTECNQQEKTCR